MCLINCDTFFRHRGWHAPSDVIRYCFRSLWLHCLRIIKGTLQCIALRVIPRGGLVDSLPRAASSVCAYACSVCAYACACVFACASACAHASACAGWGCVLYAVLLVTVNCIFVSHHRNLHFEMQSAVDRAHGHNPQCIEAMHQNTSNAKWHDLTRRAIQRY